MKNITVTPRASLPPAARRWIKHVLPADAAIPSRIRIRQEGTMEIRGRWTSFTAEGVYEGSPLSFNWTARLRMLPGVWIVAEDGHSDGQGWGGARLWGVVPMGKRTDPEVLLVQVVRNIAELAWLPELALATPDLAWIDAGEGAFEIRSSAREAPSEARGVAVRFEVNEEGDVVSAYSAFRPYDVPVGYEEAPWRYDFGDHRDFGGIRIPEAGVATYERSDGAWEYFRGRVTSVARTTAVS
jgi:hypothetical protein